MRLLRILRKQSSFFRGRGSGGVWVSSRPNDCGNLKEGEIMSTITITTDEPMVVLSLEKYEALKETIEILSNPALMRDIRKGLQEFEDGKTVDLDELWAELDEEKC